jgi:4-alpha-glucanotransferase
MKTEAHWGKVGFYAHHGILLPLSALRTKNSCGIGEFLDLIPMIDWCASLGLDVLQLLPINDRGEDPSPYNILSSCALDPIYLSLTALPEAAPDSEIFSPLTQSPRIAHQTVRREKLNFLKLYCEKHPRKQDVEQFIHQHPWAQTYALFKVYKEAYENRVWEEWPVEAREPTQSALEKMREQVEFYCYLQLLSFEQMQRVKNHAARKNVFLMGDIPILPSRDSADVWMKRPLFDLQLDAGSPPDFYNATGQHWGFPLYRWEALKKEHFAWWKQRLHVAEGFFDLYRIDHVVGFFRIWGIPRDKKNPTEGHFVPSDPTLWPIQGREILEMMINASTMLPLAEDLGTIPDFVRPILKELGICKTNVIRWQRHWHGEHKYIPFDQYEPLSITTLSTHDSEPVPLWWKNCPEEAMAFAHFKHWHYQPELSYDQHLEMLRDAHHTPSYFHINLLQEILLLFPELSWPNLEEERINIPGALLPTNWTYRFRPYVEEIVESQGLRDVFKYKILGSAH